MYELLKKYYLYSMVCEQVNKLFIMFLYDKFTGCHIKNYP